MPGCGNGTLLMTLRRNQSTAAFLGELVHRGRIAARVDRAAHQRDRARRVRVLVGLHQRGRGQHRHRRLAHRDDMGVAAEAMQDADDVVDVVVEIEAALRQRHHARVHPVGDVDVVVGQEGFDRAAQQRGVVARHRRDDQHLGLRPARHVAEHALEVQQLAERALPDGGDVDRRALAADQGGIDVPHRLGVAPRRALEQFHRRSNRLAVGGVRERIERVLEIELRYAGECACRVQRSVAHLVEPIEAVREDRAASSRRSAKFPNCHVGTPARLLRCSIVTVR